MEQVTALELRKNLAEIMHQVKHDKQKKMLVLHGEPNCALVSPVWGMVADQADQISAQHASISMNKELADIFRRQAEILEFIQKFIEATGMPPTRAEMARELGFRSANAAEEHLRALKRKDLKILTQGKTYRL